MLSRLFVLILGVSLAAFAENAPSDDAEFGVFANYEDRQGFFFDVKVGLNAASFAAMAGSNNRISPLGSLGTSYFFSPAWAAFGEIHYTKRNLTFSGASSSASFADVVVGVVWNRGAGWLGGIARETYRLGFLYGRPLGSFSGSYVPAFSLESQGAVGFHLEHQATFPIKDHFGVGYSVWVKSLLSSAVKATKVTFIDVGIGLVATFF